MRASNTCFEHLLREQFVDFVDELVNFWLQNGLVARRQAQRAINREK